MGVSPTSPSKWPVLESGMSLFFRRPTARRHVPLLGALCAVVLAGASGTAYGQIYAGASDSGAVVLSNFATDETPDLVVASPPEVALAAPLALVPPVGAAVLPNTASAYRSLIDRVAQETAVSPRLLHAVIQVESGYQPRAVSRAGAVGLMQLMPETAQRFGVRDSFDPQQNIRGGALYLKWLLDYFRGDLRLALAGYNAGEAAVVRAGFRVPAIAETRDYVPKVLWYLNRPLNG